MFTLKDMGYTNLFSLGGFKRWVDAGGETEREKRREQRNVSWLDQPALNRNRLRAEKLIDSKVLEQLICVP
jgi:hypothetical protein